MWCYINVVTKPHKSRICCIILALSMVFFWNRYEQRIVKLFFHFQVHFLKENLWENCRRGFWFATVARIVNSCLPQPLWWCYCCRWRNTTRTDMQTATLHVCARCNGITTAAVYASLQWLWTAAVDSKSCCGKSKIMSKKLRNFHSVYKPL